MCTAATAREEKKVLVFQLIQIIVVQYVCMGCAADEAITCFILGPLWQLLHRDEMSKCKTSSHISPVCLIQRCNVTCVHICMQLQLAQSEQNKEKNSFAAADPIERGNGRKASTAMRCEDDDGK